MTDNEAREAGPDSHVDFNAPAVLRKWSSLNNQRRTEGTGPYMLLDGTLDDCIREFMAKPESTRQFPSYRAALDCYHSPEYSAAMKLRQGRSIWDMAITEGYEGLQPHQGDLGGG